MRNGPNTCIGQHVFFIYALHLMDVLYAICVIRVIYAMDVMYVMDVLDVQYFCI